jgi:acyl-CoA synthetase (AMP-forming)/AMP-acid ligase II
MDIQGGLEDRTLEDGSRMPHHGPPLERPADVADLLADGLAHTPDQPGLATDAGQWSWRALDTLSTAYGARLLALGLAPGDRVASLLPNSGEQVIHYLALLKTGLVGVPLNYRYTPREMDHALGVSGARALVHHATRRADVDAGTRAARLPIRIELGGDGAHGHRLEALLAPLAGAPAFATIEPSAPAFIFFTSGSTGAAKGVTHTRASLGWILACLPEAYGLVPDDVSMPASSCSHIGAFSMVFGAFTRRSLVVLPPVGDPLVLLELMRRWRPTVVQMLPAALFQLERDGHATRDDFASLRLVAVGGDKVPDQLDEELRAKTSLPIAELYGMTETGLSLANPPSGPVRHGSVGRTAPGFTTVLRDDDGAEVPCDGPGRLWVRFPGTMSGYWDDAGATSAVLRDGWLDTGDVMRVDAEGWFWFCGRKKQLIIHDGSNIFPQEVEDALLAHDAVEAAGVIGIHDLVHGENVRAYVTWKPAATRPPLHELIAFARAQVGYKAPEEIVVLDAMPISPTGKVDRLALKQLALEATNPIASRERRV